MNFGNMNNIIQHEKNRKGSWGGFHAMDECYLWQIFDKKVPTGTPVSSGDRASNHRQQDVDDSMAVQKASNGSNWY